MATHIHPQLAAYQHEQMGRCESHIQQRDVIYINVSAQNCQSKVEVEIKHSRLDAEAARPSESVIPAC